MIVALAVLALAAASSQEQTPPLTPCASITQNVWDPKFTPGQRWTYHSRPEDSGTTVVVNKIDDVPGIGLVIQIDIDNVDFIDRGSTGHARHFERQHLAVTRDSLDVSVIEVVGTVAPLPENLISYRWWRSDCVARTYSTTLARTLDLIQAQRCAVAKQGGQTIPACRTDIPGRPTS